MSRGTLIRGGTVLALGTRTQNLTQGDVLIEDGRISEIGPGLRSRDAEVIDAQEAIIMPGFVDTHRHLWRSLLRNAGVAEADPDLVSAYAACMQPDDVYAATLIGLLGAIESGITTVADWADIPSAPEFARAAAQATSDSGMRTVSVQATPSGDHGPLTTVAFGSPTPRPDTIDSTAAAWETARSAERRIHTHVGTENADVGALAELGRRGMLGRDVTLVHCSKLDGADLDAVAAGGAHVSLTPSTEMAGLLGPPPIQELIDRNIRPGLGIDAEGMAPGDMFAQMRAVISIQHARMFDMKLAGKAGLPQLLTTREVIRYGTFDGARALGLDSVTGSLEVGKAADLIVLRTDLPNIHPVNDPIGAVVWGMDTSNLDLVLVAGKVLMRDGMLQGDVEAGRRRAIEAQNRLATESGLAGALAGGDR